MRLQFIINSDYIFFHAINQSQPDVPFKEWSGFTNRIWEESKIVFYFLAGFAEYRLYIKNEKGVENLIKKTKPVLNYIKK